MSELVESVGTTTCHINRPRKPLARLIFAHGAGAPMDSPFMVDMAQRLFERDVEVVRFEFPYMVKRRETGRKSPPDRQPVLLASFAELVEKMLGDSDLPLFIGGKSMGGRMATLAALEASASAVDGVICLGYPFHPIGKPEKLRTQHLENYPKPLLIVQGTRDTMGNAEEVAGYHLDKEIELVWLESANHDLKPLKVSGFNHKEFLDNTADVVRGFIDDACVSRRR